MMIVWYDQRSEFKINTVKNVSGGEFSGEDICYGELYGKENSKN
jgi:hypothetical protein